MCTFYCHLILQKLRWLNKKNWPNMVQVIIYLSCARQQLISLFWCNRSSWINFIVRAMEWMPPVTWSRLIPWHLTWLTPTHLVRNDEIYHSNIKVGVHRVLMRVKLNVEYASKIEHSTTASSLALHFKNDCFVKLCHEEMEINTWKNNHILLYL